MKAKLITCAFIFVLLLSLLVHATDRIIPSKDLTYLGAFKLPAPPSGYNYVGSDGGGDAMKGLEYLPTDSTLIVLLNNKTNYFAKYPAKYTIPSPVISKTLSLLPNASLQHGPVNIADGFQKGYTHLGDVHYLPAKGEQTSGKLYWSIYYSYSNDIYSKANGQLGWAEIDFNTLAPVGMWRFKNCTNVNDIYQPCSTFMGKYLFHAPQAWADIYTDGMSLISGYSRSGGSSTEGPAMNAFAPWQEGNPPPDAMDDAPPGGSEVRYPNHSLPYVSLLQYNGPPYAGSAPYHIMAEKAVNDMVVSGRWIVLGNKQAIVFNGRKCLRTWGNYSWTYPANYYPGVYWGGDNEGYHSDPCSQVLWFYDVDDITDVALGIKQRYEPQPYRRVEISPYFLNIRSGAAGMAYDEGNARLYLEELVDANTEVIHVFSLADSGLTSFDTSPPPAPVIALDSAAKDSVTFSWDAVSDDSGLPVVYRIYRNGQPIGIQNSTVLTDSYLSYYPSPVEYKVVAVDFEGNTATSNTLAIDDKVGGNAPINIYIPAFCTPNTHETSCIKLRINETNIVPMVVRGGNPPYTWSASGLPSGVTINSTTGLISGNATANNGGGYGGKIIVNDADANYARRKTSINAYKSTVTSYYYDRDQDGVYDILKGGTDTDDLNSEITPGMTYVQPSPTNLVIVNTVGNSVSLRWNPAAKRTDDTYCSAHGWSCGTSRNSQVGLDITYVVYRGNEPGVYSDSVYVGRSTSYNWSDLSSGMHYFAVSAVEFRNLESNTSNEVSATVDCPGTCLVVSTSSLSQGTFGQSYSTTLMAVGGTPPFIWSLISGSLPYGLTLQSSTGRINGTPTSSGTFQFTVEVSDSTHNSSSKALSLVVSAASNSNCGKAFGNAWIEKGSDIIETSDGGYLSVGSTASYSNINNNITSNNVVYDMYIVKTDSAGKELWHKVVGEGGSNIQEKHLGVTVHHTATAVVELADGFMVLAYQSYGNNNVVLTKLDLGGNHLWNTSVFKGYSTREGLIKTDDNNYFVIGYSGTNIYVVKVSPSGTQIWAKTYTNLRYVYPNNAKKTTDGGLIIGGYTLGGSGLNDGDLLLLKVDSSGNEQWYKSYGVSGLGENDRAWGVTQAYDGGYIIVGRTNSYDSGGETDYYILKTDSSGNEEWYRISGDPKSYLLADIVKYAGNYIVVGYYHPAPEPYTGFIMAINKTGYELWSKSIEDSEELWSLKNTSDGRLLVTGTSLSFTTGYDMFLSALDSSGNCLLTTQCNASGTYFYDRDLDYYGSYRGGSYMANYVNATGMCIQTTGYVRDNTDCNDNSPSIQSCHGADTNLDGCISFSELTAFVNRWRASSLDVSLSDLIDAIAIWKEGC